MIKVELVKLASRKCRGSRSPASLKYLRWFTLCALGGRKSPPSVLIDVTNLFYGPDGFIHLLTVMGLKKNYLTVVKLPILKL